MARASQDKPYVSLFQGLITEATGLTYPDNSVQDIDNCEINVDGSVQRRLGLVRELDGLPLFAVDSAKTKAVTTHNWDGVAGDPARRLVVIQRGLDLFLYRRDVATISTTFVTSLNLQSGDAPPVSASISFQDGGTPGATPLISSPGSGRLYMTAPWCAPFFLEYISETDEYTLTTISNALVVKGIGNEIVESINGFGGLMRDFAGLKPDPDAGTPPANTVRFSQLYNLINAGWTAELIETYFNAKGIVPTTEQQWILGKDENDNFSPDVLDKQDFGGTPAPNGRLLFTALTGIRRLNFRGMSQINQELFIFIDVKNVTINNTPFALNSLRDSKFVSNFVIESTRNRSKRAFTCLEFFAGKVFFAGNAAEDRQGGVYFSQTLIGKEDAVGAFYQAGDPTSESFSDLIDTDGGVVFIPDANAINGLKSFQTGLIVLAQNGVWFLRGSDSGFKATDYSVDKLSSIGCISGSSIIKLEDTYLFFGENSIYAAGVDPVNPRVEDIAEKKILRYYASIPLVCRQMARGVYESSEKKAYWLYSTDVDNPDVFDTVLIFDARTGAFSKYSFYHSPVDSVFIADVFPSVLLSFSQASGNFVVVNGEEVVVNGEEVSVGAVVNPLSQAGSDQKLKLLVRSKTNDPSLNNLYFGELANQGFFDYKDIPTGSGEKDYLSYFLTAPETLGDLQRYKGTTYIHSFFKKTEETFVDVGGDIVPNRQSGCILRGFWDWNISVAGNRISEAQQAYRLRKRIAAVLGAPVDTGEDVVYTKLKVRGKGRSLALRYESQTGKDFIFLGHSNAFTANGV